MPILGTIIPVILNGTKIFQIPMKPVGFSQKLTPKNTNGGTEFRELFLILIFFENTWLEGKESVFWKAFPNFWVVLWKLFCVIYIDGSPVIFFWIINRVVWLEPVRLFAQLSFGEFDPGSEWTLAAWLRHASRTKSITSVMWKVANGCVTREQPALEYGIARRKAD